MNSSISIPHSDALNWILGPVCDAVSYVAEEAKLAGLIHRGLGVLENQDAFLVLAKDKFLEEGMDDMASKVAHLLRGAGALRRMSKEVRDADFAQVGAHSLVGTWCALEVAVEDTVVLVLVKEADGLSRIKNEGVKTGGLEEGPLSEEDARRMYSRFERKARAEKYVGEAYAYMLGVMGLDVSVSRHVPSKLHEINAVRNCILHRGGIIDDRAADSVGALRSYRGRKFDIGVEKYREYHGAVGDFLQAMLHGVLKSTFIRGREDER